VSLERRTLRVSGMSCRSCEPRVELALRGVDGVRSAEADFASATVRVEFDPGTADAPRFKAALEAAGYRLADSTLARFAPYLAGLGLVALYALASRAGLFRLMPEPGAAAGYAALFVTGLLTSVHCVAMCGGLSLSQGVRAPGEPRGARAAGPRSPFAPTLLYNAGRVASYAAVGAAAGALGSVLDPTPAVRGAVTGLAALLMIAYGFRMLGFRLPRFFQGARRAPAKRGAPDGLLARLRRRGPFVVGLINGLMPCGPLQSMQLFAVGTGSALSGAAAMAVFALGTVPLMSGVGLFAALAPRRHAHAFAKAAALLVVFMGLQAALRGAALAGIAVPWPGGDAAASRPARNAIEPPALRLQPPAPASPRRVAPSTGSAGTTAAAGASSGVAAVMEGGVQTVLTEFTASAYVPIVVRAGVPLRWTVRVDAADLNGCNNPVTIPSLGIRKRLVPGDNLIEFTPRKAGVIAYACWMGMISSRITVLEAPAGSEAVGGSDGIASGSGSDPASSPVASTPSARPSYPGPVGYAFEEDGVQTLTVTAGASGFSPLVSLARRGVPLVIRFEPEEELGCVDPILFPQFDGLLSLEDGQYATPVLDAGRDIVFACSTGRYVALVRVADEPATVDAEALLAEWKARLERGG